MLIEVLHNPDQSLHSVLAARLGDPSIVRLDAAVAYVQASGALLLFDELRTLVNRGGEAHLVAAVDQDITSYEGLRTLLEVGVQLHIYRAASHAFHAKAWLLSDNVGPITAVVGSGNLTKGGLVRNAELAVRLDIENDSDRSVLLTLRHAMDQLRSHARPVQTVAELDQATIDFHIPHERSGRRRSPERQPSPQGSTTSTLVPQPAPTLSPGASTFAGHLVNEARAHNVGPTEAAGAETGRVLVMANPLRQPHTPGELRVPMAALRAAPLFWGWPDDYDTNTEEFGTYHNRRARCRFRSQGRPDSVEDDIRFYIYEQRGEFRITSGEFRSRGDAGDIIVIERSDVVGEDYVFTVVRQNEPSYTNLRDRCTISMPNSTRRWGLD